MLIKAGVFHRQQAVFHELGNLVNALVDAPFGAKATNLHAIGGKDPQGLLGLVVGERVQIRQLRVDHHRGDQYYHRAQCQQGCQYLECTHRPGAAHYPLAG